MDAALKFKERTYALLFAAVTLITLGAAAISFVSAAGNMPDAFTSTANVGLVIAIALNLLASAVMWFYGRAHLDLDAPRSKVWDLASGAVVSVALDVFALGFALSVLASPNLYVWLGIVLVIDAVIDVVVHYKR